MDHPLDERLGGEDMIAALIPAFYVRVLADPGLCHNFTMEAGDIQFVNNLATCHRRTAFIDHPVHKRHLVRLWLRDAGWRGYDG